MTAGANNSNNNPDRQNSVVNDDLRQYLRDVIRRCLLMEGRIEAVLYADQPMPNED